MKKLLILMTLILSLVLAGCSSDTPVSDSSSSDDDDKTTSSTKSKNSIEDDEDIEQDDDSDRSTRPENRYDDKYTIPEGDKYLPEKDGDKGESGISKDDDSDTSPADGEYRLATPQTLTLPQIGTFVIKSYAISESYGNKYITLKGDYTNLNEDDRALASMNDRFDAYQNDILLSSAYTGNEIDEYTYVKKGKTIEASCSFILRNETDGIEIIGADYNDVEYTVSFPIK